MTAVDNDDEVEEDPHCVCPPRVFDLYAAARSVPRSRGARSPFGTFSFSGNGSSVYSSPKEVEETKSTDDPREAAAIIESSPSGVGLLQG
jgi:hypothetical protein